MDWSPVHSASYLILILFPVTSDGRRVQNVTSYCRLDAERSVFEYEYYQDGDILIGGLISAHHKNVEHKIADGLSILYTICFFIDIEDYKAILAFIFAVDEINQDPNLLPNITLGYHIFDTCADAKKSVYSILRILSGKNKEAPNYSCMDRGEVAAFVGDSGFLTSHAMAQVLSLYKYAQINYEVTDPLFNDRDLYPTFYRIVPDDRVRYAAIIECLKYFGWNWIGIITPSDGSGEMEYRELSAMMAQHEICIEFVIKLHSDVGVTLRRMAEIDKYTARVLVICGTFSPWYISFFDDSQAIREKFTLILHQSWLNIKYTDDFFFSMVNGSFIFMLPKRIIPKINTVINDVDPSKRPGDPLLEDLWLQFFHCLSPNKDRNFILEFIFGFSGVNCTRTHRLPSSFHGIRDTKTWHRTWDPYKLRDSRGLLSPQPSSSRSTSPQLRPPSSASSPALSTFAFHSVTSFSSVTIGALSFPGPLRLFQLSHAEGVDKEEQVSQERVLKDTNRERINNYMKKVHYTDNSGEDTFFNERGQSSSTWLIANMVIHENGGKYDIEVKPLASFQESVKNKMPDIDQGEIKWKNDTKPQSRCNDRCSAGDRKASNGGHHVCCYICVPCAEGEMSNNTDSEICHKCPEDEWPDEKKVKCVPKTYEFLSYEKDMMVSIFLVLTFSFSAVTLFILGSFIYSRDTPLVKANNRTVSFILLVSIFFSFLCVFLFLGCPVDITCLLRQTAFGIFFSVAVSSVLGKTITVCIAFKATKPGSAWRTWVSLKVSNYAVVICSSVQVLICVLWLLVSPPYVEFDHHSYPGKIIIQCNEGSDIWFYSMLGYLGLLASVSFVLAFMVRTLPDSFNEAKYITFSMLVFCSVWIAMIPAYLSTRGKNMVAVEIFAILTSCAGVLGCIFVPKLHIMLLRPELNTRKIILQK
ncbi:vomeronasal type-2 receptor 26-like [Rhinoderma darwinii]|uniref:vomeronasal type-2 receptor 26-like n=1 Tax=Rhinoderma darwinii TaxID=43563 RepID=UPI003F67F8FA